MNSIQSFAEDIRSSLEGLWSPALVAFRGSFATSSFDDYSDVDLHADIHQPLTDDFFDVLHGYLSDRHGPALIRYDPDFRNDTAAQGLRISFYNRPIFWRIDLNIASSTPTRKKRPHPFPKWSVGNSALMNLAWAVKYDKRCKPDLADAYLATCCDKLGQPPKPFRVAYVRSLLSFLGKRPDIDKRLVAKVADVVGGDSSVQ